MQIWQADILVVRVGFQRYWIIHYYKSINQSNVEITISIQSHNHDQSKDYKEFRIRLFYQNPYRLHLDWLNSNDH